MDEIFWSDTVCVFFYYKKNQFFLALEKRLLLQHLVSYKENGQALNKRGAFGGNYIKQFGEAQLSSRVNFGF